MDIQLTFCTHKPATAINFKENFNSIIVQAFGPTEIETSTRIEALFNQYKMKIKQFTCSS
jgi:hypothetical protein